jgi:hypothetical protein
MLHKLFAEIASNGWTIHAIHEQSLRPMMYHWEATLSKPLASGGRAIGFASGPTLAYALEGAIEALLKDAKALEPTCVPYTISPEPEEKPDLDKVLSKLLRPTNVPTFTRRYL